MTCREEKAPDPASPGIAQAGPPAPTTGQQIGTVPNYMLVMLQTRLIPFHPR